MTIPAKRIVVINPSVVSGSGSPLSLKGLYLTSNVLMPAGRVIEFGSVKAVSDFFGAGSTEAAKAAKYWAGYRTSTLKPSGLLFYYFAGTARAASLTSGSLAGLTLSQLQALTGTVIVTMDGVVKTSSTITLSGASSFTNAASIIAAAFTSGPAVTWDSVNSKFIFTSATTGATSSMSYGTGTLATSLKLTQALGASISIGTAADTPAGAMDEVTAITENFATFSTIFEPVTADKTAFTVWSAGKNSQFLYVGWDSDPNAANNQNDASTWGNICKVNAYDGVICLSGDTATATADQISDVAAFAMGMVASIDFSRRNGRVVFAGRGSDAVATVVGDDTKGQNLLSNGYSFYGAYASAAQQFQQFQDGALPGKWAWADAFINQVWMNSNFQAALMNLRANTNSLPYNPDGYGLERAALLDPINAAVNFGAIRTGVALSQAQLTEVNQAAGVDIGNVLSTTGWYLQILDPGATVRINRGTPVINFWYTDGGSVQSFTMASIDIM